MKRLLSYCVPLILVSFFSAAVAWPGQEKKPARSLLWQDPSPIANRDLFWGSGAEARAPQPPFRFQEENTGGSQPKLVVRDARGDVWDVKLGREPSAEVAANRFMWAFGYLVEEVYHVREGVIQNVGRLKRADEHLGPDGRFAGARFRRRDPRMMRTAIEWSFTANPFLSTREFSGLKILTVMINNWDVDGARNNKVLQVTPADGSLEHWYIVADLGGTFGKMGGPGLIKSRSKWNLADFQTDGFIERVKGGELELDYSGYEPTAWNLVPLDHARWFAGLAAQLTPAQIRRAFEAAGATGAEADGFSAKIAEKIAELQRVTAAATTREPVPPR